MKDVYISVCIAELVIIGLLIIRLARGPSVADRIVALNTISTQAAIVVLFFAAFGDRSIFIGITLWLASFSFVAALMWSRYLERGLL